MSHADEQSNDFDAVRLSARLHARDRYYAALFAPAEARSDLIALAAFTGEIERVVRRASEPAIGEIRIAWWRDALLSGKELGRSGNPVLDAVAARLVQRRALPLEAFENYLGAQAQALCADPPVDDAVLSAELRIIDGMPLRFAAAILGVSIDGHVERVLAAAARASGLKRIAIELHYALRRGRSPISRARAPRPDHAGGQDDWRPRIAWLSAEAAAALGAMRHQLAGHPRVLTTALLPLALVEPYFRALEKARNDPARDIVEISPIASLWRVACAHWSGRI